MTTKTFKTLLLGALFAILFVPTMGMNNVSAQDAPYTLDKIDHAFTAASRGNYVTTASDNVMIVDKQQMEKDGVDNLDVEIMTGWAKVHNGAMEAMKTGDKNIGKEYYKHIQNGKFRLLTNTDVPAIPYPKESAASNTLGNAISAAGLTVGTERNAILLSHPGQNYWSLTACGITYGSTQHSNPTIQIGINGYSTLALAQLALSNLGYTQLQTPYTDSGSVGYDYGKINSNGQGGCTGGEFRDQQYLYDSTTHVVGGVSYGPVHALMQVNEPNPNLAEYNAPTYWWDTYTYFWHLAN